MGLGLSQGVFLDVLQSPARLMTSSSSDLNNNSAVLRLRPRQFSVLLTGDVMEEADRMILASGDTLTSLVLKVPHQGGDTSPTTPFLKAVGPLLAFISAGDDNCFGHPDEVTLEKLGDIPI
jgi:competence protein ComEC